MEALQLSDLWQLVCSNESKLTLERIVVIKVNVPENT
jgi:hypothetical protein